MCIKECYKISNELQAQIKKLLPGLEEIAWRLGENDRYGKSLCKVLMG